MLELALEMVKKNKDFYELAIEKCSCRVGDKLYRILKDDQVRQLERINLIYDSLKSDGKWTDKWTAIKVREGGLKIFFKDLISKYEGDSQLNTCDGSSLEIMIDLETRSIGYFKNSLKLAEHAQEKVFLESMISETESHREVLQEFKKYLEGL